MRGAILVNKFKKSFLVYSFFFTLGAVTLWGESVTWKRSRALRNDAEKRMQIYDQESYFQEVSFYKVRNQKKILHLDSSELTVNTFTEKSLFVDPRGVAFTKTEEPIQYEAKKGFLIQKENKVIFENKVKFNMNKSLLRADKVTYFMDKEEISSIGNVYTLSKSKDKLSAEKIQVWSNISNSWPSLNKSTYLGNVRGIIKRKKVYEESVRFRSEKVDVNLNTLKIDLIENVQLKKQLLIADSHRGEIFLENYNKKLKYFVLYDDVKVVEKVELEKDGRVSSFERRAFGEKLEGIMSENKIILTGYPKVFQQKDVITGNKIVLRENNEIVEVDDANTNFILR